jgi:hypothetical protein
MVRGSDTVSDGSMALTVAVSVGRSAGAACAVRTASAKPLVGSCANATYMVGGVSASSAPSLMSPTMPMICIGGWVEVGAY